MKRIRVRLHWGFPLASLPDGGPRRGVAIMIAVVALTMVMIFTADLILSSQVGLQLAVGQRDNLKSEYMAKSAVNLGLFMLMADFGIDEFLAGPQSPMPSKPKDGPDDIWATLNGIPVGGSTLELVDKTQASFDLDRVNDGKVIDMLKLFDGSFTLNVTDESSRINVNFLAKGHRTEIVSMLQALMSCPVEQQFLEVEKVKPRELIYRMVDWVDDNTRAEAESGTNDEDDFYRSKNPPYRAKNAPFDTVEELRMVEGWSDDMHSVFAPFLTVYPVQASGQDKHLLNINTTARSLLSCLFPPSTTDCSMDKNLTEAQEDKASLATDPGKIAEVMQRVFCYAPQPGGEAGGGDPSKWFTVSSRVFRIEGRGEVGDQQRTITAVIERQKPDLTKRAFKLLFWKMDE